MQNVPSDANLFEEHFKIDAVLPGRYARVARLECKSLDESITMRLDVNTELYPCVVGETIKVVLATSLSLDGSKDDEKGWRDVAKTGNAEATLADGYDYVCHGKIYKFEDGKDGLTINAYISYGGLLMSLSGPYKKLTPLRVDDVYLLVKK
ncbi:hypothetical protein V8F33_011563 [Rhypophila sp. PSN 637]